jgi:hypothetical protein
MSAAAEPTNGHGAYKDEAGVPAAAPAVNYQHTVSQMPAGPLANLANPGPLGLIGFALTTFVLGLYQCGAGLLSLARLQAALTPRKASPIPTRRARLARIRPFLAWQSSWAGSRSSSQASWSSLEGTPSGHASTAGMTAAS